jgi:pSer/pThr/pTyr-binding forkhead associated (FHA) protein
LIKLIIEDDEGRRTVHASERPEVTIGRQEGNTVRLDERNVSRRHARIFRQNGTVFLEDLDSYNGVRVNGKLLEGRARITERDRIQIGDFQLAIHPESSAAMSSDASSSEEVDLDASAVMVEIPEPEPTLPQLEGEARPLVEIDSNLAPRLLVLNTKYSGQEFLCRRSELRIGRAPHNDVALDHRSLSETQARLSCSAAGEWQIIDLESSNGVRVNGKPFGKATLQSGDVLKIGDVKLKFLLPAPAAAAVRPPPPPGSRKGVLASSILAAGLATSAGLWWMNREQRSASVSSSSRMEVGREPAGNPRQEPGEKAPPAAASATSTAPEPVNSRVDTPPPLQQREEPDSKVSVAAATPTSSPEVPAEPGAPSEEVQKLFEEGLSHYRKHQFSAAAASLSNCLRSDPSFSKCHMVLGSTYARLREPELGAQHYRKFLQLAPDDPEAARIKIYLEQYESAKANVR